jgi:3-hydroxyacyl-[acyl-carrier protein] dehydratase / trans-2-decenoyl-[acyl-carrier protein] isomerase
VALFKNSFNYEELIDCAKGRLAGLDFPKLPLPPMLMFEEIIGISETGGSYGKGSAHAMFSITPDKWFFECHFENDPVMPGCLGMDALWQLLGFSLGNMGGRGKGRAISVGEVKFSGQILPSAKKVEYFLDFKRIIMRKLILGIADGKVICDDKVVFEASDIRVGLFQD